MRIMKCKAYKTNLRKKPWTFDQESEIGYSEYFHMSRANKLSKLSGYPFFMNKISYDAHPFFSRSSDYAKWKRDLKKPLMSEDEWREFCNEIKKGRMKNE